jgi:hypothetical protein
VAWYSPLMPFSEPLPIVLQSWFPLFSYIKDRERTTPHFSPPDGGARLLGWCVWTAGSKLGAPLPGL